MTPTIIHPKQAGATRRLTICGKAFPRELQYIHLPSLNLSGKWLQESGFKIGQVVDITCGEGTLTITISPQQRFDRFKQTR